MIDFDARPEAPRSGSRSLSRREILGLLAATGFTGNPTIPNMNLTPCRLRLLATKVAPSTSLMRSLQARLVLDARP